MEWIAAQAWSNGKVGTVGSSYPAVVHPQTALYRPPHRDYPDGYPLHLSDSILRVRYRNGFDHEELLTPAAIYPIMIELAPTSTLFQKKASHSVGHFQHQLSAL